MKRTLLEQVSLESKKGVKKLVSVSATSTPMTKTRKEAVETAKAVDTTKIGKNSEESKGEYPNLAQIPYIWYPIIFRKKPMSMSAFLNLGSEVNAIHPTFARKLGLPIRPTDVGAQKIDGTMLNTFGMVVKSFSVTDKGNWVRFFEEIFLVANVSPEVVLGMLFLTLSIADVNFLGRELWWKTYTTKKTLPTTKCIKPVGKKKFAAVAFDPEHETYVVHVRSVSSNTLPNSSPLNVHPSWRPQIFGLIAEEAFTKVFAEYSDFANVFSPDLASELLKYTGINDHAIELVKGCQ